MKITATLCKGKDLAAGDLFSTAPQGYWDNPRKYVIGEKVYIRSEYPHTTKQGEDEVYKITIEKGDEQA